MGRDKVGARSVWNYDITWPTLTIRQGGVAGWFEQTRLYRTQNLADTVHTIKEYTMKRLLLHSSINCLKPLLHQWNTNG